MLNDTGNESIDTVFQLSNTQRRTVRCGECVLTEKLLQRRSLHVYTTTIGFERPRHSGSDDLTSQVNKSMRFTGAYLKGLKWHLLKQNRSGVLNICKTLDLLLVICINESTVITIFAQTANILKTIYTLLDATVQVPQKSSTAPWMIFKNG